MKKELYTEIEINASPAKVWKILTDFAEFPNRNPFIRKAEGNLAVGEKLKAFIQPFSGLIRMEMLKIVKRKAESKSN